MNDIDEFSMDWDDVCDISDWDAEPGLDYCSTLPRGNATTPAEDQEINALYEHLVNDAEIMNRAGSSIQPTTSNVLSGEIIVGHVMETTGETITAQYTLCPDTTCEYCSTIAFHCANIETYTKRHKVVEVSAGIPLSIATLRCVATELIVLHNITQNVCRPLFTGGTDHDTGSADNQAFSITTGKMEKIVSEMRSCAKHNVGNVGTNAGDAGVFFPWSDKTLRLRRAGFESKEEKLRYTSLVYDILWVCYSRSSAIRTYATLQYLKEQFEQWNQRGRNTSEDLLHAVIDETFSREKGLLYLRMLIHLPPQYLSFKYIATLNYNNLIGTHDMHTVSVHGVECNVEQLMMLYRCAYGKEIAHVMPVAADGLVLCRKTTYRVCSSPPIRYFVNLLRALEVAGHRGGEFLAVAQAVVHDEFPSDTELPIDKLHYVIWQTPRVDPSCWTTIGSAECVCISAEPPMLEGYVVSL